MMLGISFTLVSQLPSISAAPLTNNCSTPGTVSIDSTTGTIIAQVLPFIGLFGETITYLFLSQSIDLLDGIILAVGPLGVIWTVKATIRILGGPFLKTCFGVKPEELAFVERDLMSSTSENVCELWNGQGISRIVGQRKIRELILVNGEILRPKEAKRDYFTAKNVHKLSSFHEKAGLSKSLKPPNILLNVGPRNRKLKTRGIFVVAVVLEVIFFVVVVLMKWEHHLRSRFSIPLAYFVLTLAGTASLLTGLIACAWEISDATIKTTYEPNGEDIESTVSDLASNPDSNSSRAPALRRASNQVATPTPSPDHNPAPIPDYNHAPSLVANSHPDALSGARAAVRNSLRVPAEVPSLIAPQVLEKPLHRVKDDPLIIWLQRGTEEDSEASSSYIIVKDIKKEIIESHRDSYFPRSYCGVPVAVRCFLYIFLISAGYVCQVIGVANMHYPTQLSLFGVTVIMAVLRSFLRPTPDPLKAVPTSPMCEMDWLATVHCLGPRKSRTLRPNNESTLLNQKDNLKAPIWTIIGGQGYIHPRNASQGPNTSKLIRVRQDLGEVCKWKCPATKVAHALALSIEAVANKWNLPSNESTFEWYLKIDLGYEPGEAEYLSLSITKEDGRWKPDENDLQCALSLWLFYDEETNNQRAEDREDIERGIRLLGSESTGNELARRSDLSKLRFVREFKKICENNKPTASHKQDAKTFDRSCRRNRVVGFNNTLNLDFPSGKRGSQPPYKSEAGIYHANHTEYNYEFIMSLPNGNQITSNSTTASPTTASPTTASPATASPTATNSTAADSLKAGRPPEAGPEVVAPVAVSWSPTDELYAQHMLSGFVWALSSIYPKTLAKNLPANQDNWDEDILKSLAGEIRLTGIGDYEDALLSLLPPLLEEDHASAEPARTQ